MNIRIVQPAGLGDILFCSKIAKELIRAGNELFWPVIPQYSWIGDYLKVDGLHWHDSEEVERIIDLQSAGRVFPDIPIMDAKYKMVGMDYCDWQSYIDISRNMDKEQKLRSMHTGNEAYCLICEIYASPPGSVMRTVDRSAELCNVYIKSIEGYTPFDWCHLIENATELKLVDTCFTYLVEILNTQAKRLVLYSRDGKFYTDHIWTKPWEYVK